MRRKAAREQYVKGILIMAALAAINRPDRLSADCPVITTLDGDEDVIAAVADRLLGFGIQTDAVGKCPSVPVTVEKQGERYVLMIHSRSGIDYLREVDSVDTVAVLIDAYAREKAEEMPMVSVGHEEKVVSEPSSSVESEARAPVEAPKTDEKKIRLQLLFEPTYGVDKTLWMGGKLGGCGRIGPICLGFHVRFASDTGHIGPSHDGDVERLLLDGALFAHFLVSIGRFQIYPGISIGGGYYAAKHRFLEDHEERNVDREGGARFEVFVSVAIRVKGDFSIEIFNISGSFSAPHHAEEVVEDVNIAPPKAYLRGGVGFRYDLPFGS